VNRVLPRLALHALSRTAHPILVAARRGQVLHVVDAGCCHPAHSLTPTGQVRQAFRPLCGQRAKRWHHQDSPTRPLCSTCTYIARRHLRPTDWRRLDVLDVLRAVAMSTDARDVQAATRAAVEVPALAGDRALRELLRARRAQLLPQSVAAADVAWLTGQRAEPHPHPPVRHNFAA